MAATNAGLPPSLTAMVKDSKRPAVPSLTWPPPPALEQYAEAIVNDCEEAEMNPSSLAMRPMMVPIHMAALLYLGEYVHVEHLRRRMGQGTIRGDPLAEAWWNVCRAIREGNESVIGAMLEEYAQTHPEPLNIYASQVQMAYRARRVERGKPSGHSMLDTTKIVSFLEAMNWNA